MATTADEISFSNVALLLKRRPSQTPIRYHAIPRFVLDSTKLQPRSFPYNLPTGPHRPHSQMGRPPALGLGNIKGLKEKKDEETSQQLSSLPPIEQEHEEKKELSTAKIVVRSKNTQMMLMFVILRRFLFGSSYFDDDTLSGDLQRRVIRMTHRCQSKPGVTGDFVPRGCVLPVQIRYIEILGFPRSK